MFRVGMRQCLFEVADLGDQVIDLGPFGGEQAFLLIDSAVQPVNLDRQRGILGDDPGGYPRSVIDLRHRGTALPGRCRDQFGIADLQITDLACLIVDPCRRQRQRNRRDKAPHQEAGNDADGQHLVPAADDDVGNSGFGAKKNLAITQKPTVRVGRRRHRVPHRQSFLGPPASAWRPRFGAGGVFTTVQTWLSAWSPTQP